MFWSLQDSSLIRDALLESTSTQLLEDTEEMVSQEGDHRRVCCPESVLDPVSDPMAHAGDLARQIVDLAVVDTVEDDEILSLPGSDWEDEHSLTVHRVVEQLVENAVVSFMAAIASIVRMDESNTHDLPVGRYNTRRAAKAASGSIPFDELVARR